jgi:hypothetical protein
MIKIPTSEDYRNYNGAHTHKLWVSVGDNWRCPACDRSKFEVLRWTKRFPRSPSPFEGWMAPLHDHHDHGQGMFFADYARFPRTVICDQCNSADGQAKRRCGLPADFSFAPWEIKQFVAAVPHSPHKIDLEQARTIYDALYPAPRAAKA